MEECWQKHGWTDLNDGSSSWFSSDWRPDRIILRSSLYECPGNVAQVLGTRKTGLQVHGPDGIVETPSDHFALSATIHLKAGMPLPTPVAAAPPLANARTPHPPAVPAAKRVWSLQNTREAVSGDSPLVFSCTNASGSLAGLDCMNVTAVV